MGTDHKPLASTRQPYEYQVSAESIPGGTNSAKLLLHTLSANDDTTNSESGQVRAVMCRLANQAIVGTNNIFGIYRFCEINAGLVFTNYLDASNLSDVALPRGHLPNDDRAQKL